MRGVDPKAVEKYILEADKSSPKEEQTIWNLQRLGIEKQAYYQKLLDEARIQRTKGRIKIDEAKLVEAYLYCFRSAINKIQNWMFFDPKLQKNGWMDIEGHDGYLIDKVFEELVDDDRLELIEVIQNIGRLSDEAKKKSGNSDVAPDVANGQSGASDETVLVPDVQSGKKGRKDAVGAGG